MAVLHLAARTVYQAVVTCNTVQPWNQLEESIHVVGLHVAMSIRPWEKQRDPAQRVLSSTLRPIRKGFASVAIAHALV
jgi:hypothetical protein